MLTRGEKSTQVYKAITLIIEKSRGDRGASIKFYKANDNVLLIRERKISPGSPPLQGIQLKHIPTQTNGKKKKHFFHLFCFRTKLNIK